MRTLKHALLAATLLAGAAGAMDAAAQELRIGLSSQPSSMDPHYHNLTPNNALARHVFDRLLLTDDKQKLIPGLAEAWKPLNDTTWEFKLRQGVKFHDGSPLTVEDVIFTFERAGNVPNSPSSFGINTKGKTLAKVDDHTFTVTTAQPSPLLPNEVASIAIISRKHGENAKTEDYNSGKAAIGTGPYKFVQFTPGDRIVLEANADYWGGKPRWSKVTLKPIVSGPSRVSALLAGDIDVIEEAPTQDIARLKKEPNIVVSQGVSNRVIYLGLEQQKDEAPGVVGKDGQPLTKNPFKDLRVRKALSMAINRPALVERVMEGVAIPASQFLADGFFGTSPNLKVQAYDAAGAKKLLAEAGYPQGFGMTITGPNGRYINDAKIVEALAQMFTRAGIDTKVETIAPAPFFTRVSKQEFGIFLLGWGSDTGEVSSPLKSLVATYDPAKGTGPSNRGRYSNPELDKVLEQALATVDDAAREKLLQKGSEIAINDLGIIPLHYQVNTWASRKGFAYHVRTDESTVANNVFPE